MRNTIQYIKQKRDENSDRETVAL